MQKLELTDEHKSLIQRVCDLEHSSLIRCHDHTEEELQETADLLNMVTLSIKEYHLELSNAFYEFQVVFEDPDSVFNMPPHYLGVFQGMMEIYQNALQEEYPDIYQPFFERVTLIKNLFENPLISN